ncbi:MAG: hypothetical protein ACREFQ_13705 [Stellaceae bacterium]
MSELVAGFSIFKGLTDLAKSLIDLGDTAARKRAGIEFLEKLVAAELAQLDLIARVRQLEEEIARMKAWSAEKERYELHRIGSLAFAYLLKPDAQPPEPPHWLCAGCYQQAKKGILQFAGLRNSMMLWQCPLCSTPIHVPEGTPP